MKKILFPSPVIVLLCKKIVGSPTIDNSIRQLASITVKNVVGKYWVSNNEEG